MELSVSDVAGTSGRSERAVQLAVRSGALPALRQIGRSWMIDDVAARAWMRSQASGRTLSQRMRTAALQALDGERITEVAGSELSRLRRRLRGMTAREYAHAVGGLGGAWGRYRKSAAGPLVGAKVVRLVEGGLVGEARRRLVQVVDLDEFELRSPVVLDADGDLCVVGREDELTDARRLVDTYLVGDARASHAAAVEIERRLARVHG